MSHRIGGVGKVPPTGSERKAEAELFSYMSRALTDGVVGQERGRHCQVVRHSLKQRLPSPSSCLQSDAVCGNRCMAASKV